MVLSDGARDFLRESRQEFERLLAELERRVPATTAERLRAACRLLNRFRAHLTSDQLALAETILAVAGVPAVHVWCSA